MKFSFKSFKGDKGAEEHTASARRHIPSLSNTIYAELTALKKWMAQHAITVPPAQEQWQLQDGLASSSSSDQDVLDLDVCITNTKQKRRQMQVFKPTTNAPTRDLIKSLASSILRILAWILS
ncbi:hypothetical protein ACEQ8H_007522 [Pleosporales sp. CAS-2024a]